MMNNQLCAPFIKEYRDDSGLYASIIKTPMCLETVTAKLQNHIYKNIKQFQGDVNLIWDNAVKFNEEGSVISIMALEMKYWFNKKMKRFSMTPEEEWMKKTQRNAKKMLLYVNRPPRDVDPMGKHTLPIKKTVDPSFLSDIEVE